MQEHKLLDGARLYCSPYFSILIGCPPEILKVIFQKKLPMPDTIVLPDELHKFHSSQSNLEFPFYHFLFVQQGLAQGRKMKVFAKGSVCAHLKDMLRVTLVGPNQDEVNQLEKMLKIPLDLDQNKIEQVLKETHHLALKGADGHVLQIDELVDFIPLEINEEKAVFEGNEDENPVTLIHKDNNQFEISCGDCRYTPDLNISGPQLPTYEIKDIKASKEEKTSDSLFSVRCIGSSDGFDPSHGANGYLFRFKGKWVLWDAPAYTHEHLEKIGLSLEDMDAVFISHVHEDHLDPVETISEKGPVPIYTSPEIFYSAVIKLMTILECSWEEALGYYDFHPVYANQPFDLFGADAEVFYSAHAIPSLGIKLIVEKTDGEYSRFFLSGDHLSQKAIANMIKEGVLAPWRKKEFDAIPAELSKYDLIFIDAGGGLIHGDPSDYYKVKNTIHFMHTGGPIKNLPKQHKLLTSGKRFILHH